MIVKGDQIILEITDYDLWFRVLLARCGGSTTFRLDDLDVAMSDGLQLFIEVEDDRKGVTLSVHRVDETAAGHA